MTLERAHQHLVAAEQRLRLRERGRAKDLLAVGIVGRILSGDAPNELVALRDLALLVGRERLGRVDENEKRLHCSPLPAYHCLLEKFFLTDELINMGFILTCASYPTVGGRLLACLLACLLAWFLIACL